MLNGYLGTESYITGPVPTKDDIELYKAFGENEPDSRWVHIRRWHDSIQSLGLDMGKWPQEWRVEAAAAQPSEVEVVVEGKQAKAKTPSTRRPTYSAVLLDVKVADEEVDMAKLEAAVRSIEMETLEWKTSQLIPVMGTIKKLRILAHFEDDSFSMDDDLIPAIEELEDMVQSVDIESWSVPLGLSAMSGLSGM